MVPLGDGAGVVQAIGPQVTRFQVGDRVIPIFHQGHLAGSLDAKSIKTGLGSSLDGTLRPYGAFDEERLVKLPGNLSFIEGATLPCAALTAWSALYGLQGKAVVQGDTVLTQGTGGVSLFALQVSNLFPSLRISSHISTVRQGVRCEGDCYDIFKGEG